MRIFSGEHHGNLEVREELTVRGAIHGHVVVRDGAVFTLQGLVAGNVEIHKGGVANLQGMVVGSVSNDGIVDVSGMIQQNLVSASTATTRIQPGSMINGQLFN